MVLRDDTGTFVMGLSKVWSGCMDRYLEALSWIKNLGLSIVIVEWDSKIVVDAIKSNLSYLSVFGDYVSSCKAILVDVPSFSVGLVCRDANILAHSLARASKSFELSYCWYDPSDFVVGLPNAPCSCNNIN